MLPAVEILPFTPEENSLLATEGLNGYPAASLKEVRKDGQMGQTGRWE